MADPSRTASVGDGLDGLKRVGLPASAHQRPSFPNRDPMEIAFEDRCSRFDRYLKRLRANGDKQWGLVILEKSAHHELPAEPPPNRDPLR